MNIFLRYAAKTTYLPNHFLTRAYDARMLFVLEGKGKIYFENEEYDLEKNTLCYYPPGTAYMPVSDSKDPLCFVTLNFDLSLKYKNFQKILNPVPAEKYDQNMELSSHTDCAYNLFTEKFVFKDLLKLRGHFLEIAEKFGSAPDYFKKATSYLLQYVCYCLLEYDSLSANKLYFEAVNYINSHYAQINSNNDVALFLNYHPYYVNQIFKKYNGMSLHKYIKNFKLKKASELLQNSNDAISDVAAAVGFSDPNYFSSCFSSEFGCSPSAFRKKSRIFI